MLEARIVKAIIQPDEKGRSVLMGVAEYYGEAVNFKAVYDWETLDKSAFLQDLREQLAEDFNLPVHRVDIQGKGLLEMMGEYYARGM